LKLNLIAFLGLLLRKEIDNMIKSNLQIIMLKLLQKK